MLGVAEMIVHLALGRGLISSRESWTDLGDDGAPVAPIRAVSGVSDRYRTLT
jgi:hypothetical protein